MRLLIFCALALQHSLRKRRVLFGVLIENPAIDAYAEASYVLSANFLEY
jgi:hypothetical protein